MKRKNERKGRKEKNKKRGRGMGPGVRGTRVLRRVGPHTNNTRSI